MKFYFIQFLIRWFVIRFHIYFIWSKIYQSLFQKKRKVLPVLRSVSEVQIFLSKSTWRSDKWYMLWDAISHPEYAYYEFEKTGSLGDCEDHSIVAAYLLKEILGTTPIKILSVQWLDQENKFHGHNVCVFNAGYGKLAYIGNWFHGEATYGFYTIEEIAKSIVGDTQIISWFTFSMYLDQIYEWKVYPKCQN